MDNESNLRRIEHDEIDEVLYETLREDQRERRHRFIAVLVRGSEDYRVSVTELTFSLTGGAATYVRGSMPVLTKYFPTCEQAEAEAKLVFDDYLEHRWLKVLEYRSVCLA